MLKSYVMKVNHLINPQSLTPGPSNLRGTVFSFNGHERFFGQSINQTQNGAAASKLKGSAACL